MDLSKMMRRHLNGVPITLFVLLGKRRLQIIIDLNTLGTIDTRSTAHVYVLRWDEVDLRNPNGLTQIESRGFLNLSELTLVFIDSANASVVVTDISCTLYSSWSQVKALHSD